MRTHLPNVFDWSDFPKHWPLYVNSLLLILLFCGLNALPSAGRLAPPKPWVYHRSAFAWPPDLRSPPQYFSIPERELPDWMQDLLADPGWNKPYIEPRSRTPMPTPSTSQLLELTRERMANPPELVPRDSEPRPTDR